MNVCFKCKSDRVGQVEAKCSDSFFINIGDRYKSSENGSYVDTYYGIGSDDYIEFIYCLDCGQIQNTFPRPISDIEDAFDGLDIDEEFDIVEDENGTLLIDGDNAYRF